MSGPEVRDFIIIPPFTRQRGVQASKELLVEHLSRQFPRLNFTIAPCAPVDDDDHFSVIPIMGTVGGHGESQLCEMPKPWLISEIAKACDDFDDSSVLRLVS